MYSRLPIRRTSKELNSLPVERRTRSSETTTSTLRVRSSISAPARAESRVESSRRPATTESMRGPIPLNVILDAAWAIRAAASIKRYESQFGLGGGGRNGGALDNVHAAGSTRFFTAFGTGSRSFRRRLSSGEALPIVLTPHAPISRDRRAHG